MASVWPPPVAIDRPGLRKTKPKRAAAGDVELRLLRAAVIAHQISQRVLAQCWNCSPKLAHDKVSGRQPLHVREIFLLPKHVRVDMFAQAITADLSMLPTAV